jgi:hypothetical protein
VILAELELAVAPRLPLVGTGKQQLQSRDVDVSKPLFISAQTSSSLCVRIALAFNIDYENWVVNKMAQCMHKVVRRSKLSKLGGRQLYTSLQGPPSSNTPIGSAETRSINRSCPARRLMTSEKQM